MAYPYATAGYATAGSSSSSRAGPDYRWWVPSEGISRQIIQAEIQRYLGPDALVKPGPGKGDNEGVPGFYISAYRNLTTAMLEDLKKETLKAERELDTGGRYAETGYDSRHGGHAQPAHPTQPGYPQQQAGYAQHTAGYDQRQQATPQYAGGAYPPRQDPYQYPPQQVPYGTPQPSVSPASLAAQYSSHYTTNPSPGWLSIPLSTSGDSQPHTA